MTVEEARAVWLLRMGKEKVSHIERYRIRVGDELIVSEALEVLLKNDQFENDLVSQWLKIKCKS